MRPKGCEAEKPEVGRVRCEQRGFLEGVQVLSAVQSTER